MIVYIIVGENREFENISARAAYTTREQAEAHLNDPKRMWFDDRAVIVELELDCKAVQGTSPAEALAW